MATRYFLVPMDDAVKDIVIWKYADVLDPTKKAFIYGAPAKKFAYREYLRNYYLLKIIPIDEIDFSPLLAMPDVIEVTADAVKTNATALSAVGVDVAGLDLQSTAEEYEKRTIKWLRDEDDRTLADLFAGRGTEHEK